MDLTDKIAELGRGRFSIVECWRSADKKFVAIKSFVGDDSRARENELRSIRAVGAVSCYIAQVINQNIDKHNNMHCIMMDAYLGGPLNKHIQQCKGTGFHMTVTRSYLCEVVSALSHLERVHCIHRDIKSSNCVLDQTGHLKLCDFGSAKILQHENVTAHSRPSTASKAESETISERTMRTYTITGTAVTMAPEMAAATAGYDFSVDYWAVGVLLYELLTGRLPAWDRSSPELHTLFDHPVVSNAEHIVWPDMVAAEVSRAAIGHDASSAIQQSTAEHKPSSRPSTATKAQIYDNQNVATDERQPILSAARRSWFLETVDPTFGSSPTATKTNANSDLNAILGNFSFTPKKSEEQILRERACDLVRVLLTVSPSRRHQHLLASRSSSTTNHVSPLNAWNAALRMHPFFEGVDWESVDAGLTPPPNPHFDRRLGCMELLSEFDSSSDELTEAQQALFEGF